MRILVDITHPAYVHFYRNAIKQWLSEGDQVVITSRIKDITTSLLDELGFDHRCLSSAGRGLVGLGFELIKRSLTISKIVSEWQPDVLTAAAGPFIVYSGKRHRIPSVVFYDTEHDYISNAITYPLATVVVTPRSYEGNIGKKQIRYPGYHALAYTHPEVFSPDPSVLAVERLEQDEPFIIVRLVNWRASHDIGDSGVNDLREVVETLSPYGRIILSSERNLPSDLQHLQMNGPRKNMLHLQAFARLFFGESGTMAAESTLLGTPAVFVSTSKRGYINEMQNRYGLVYPFHDELGMQRSALNKAVEILSTPSHSHEWNAKHQKMMSELINVSQFIVETVRKYAARGTQSR